MQSNVEKKRRNHDEYAKFLNMIFNFSMLNFMSSSSSHLPSLTVHGHEIMLAQSASSSTF